MNTSIELFDQHVHEYEEWFDQYPYVFQSEIEAVREMLPEGDSLSGIEIGLGTGRYSMALKIKEGIEPSRNMRTLAIKRGIDAMEGVAEKLPYGDMRFDFAVMLFCISYFNSLKAAFKEAHRILKRNGSLVIGFIDKESPVGKHYEAHKSESIFYRQARFYSVDRVVNELSQAGFRHFTFRQTLFGELDAIQNLQPSKEGYGEGSFVVIQASKKFSH